MRECLAHNLDSVKYMNRMTVRRINADCINSGSNQHLNSLHALIATDPLEQAVAHTVIMMRSTQTTPRRINLSGDK